MSAWQRLVRGGWIPGIVGLLGLAALVGLSVVSIRVPPPWFALAALTTMEVLPAKGLRDDPRGFASVGGPILGLAVLALVMPWPANAALDAVAFVLLFSSTLLADRIWPFWSSAVLRRPPLPSWWKIDLTLTEEAEEFRRLSEQALADPAQRDRVLRTARGRVMRLRKLRAPDAEWAGIRDELAAWEEAWLERTIRGELDSDDLAARAADLTARRDSLRNQG